MRGGYGMRGGGFDTLLVFIGILLGLYYLNSTFNWVAIPNQFLALEPGINVVAGILLIFFALARLFRPRHAYY